MAEELLEYGKKGNSNEIKEILLHIFDRNNQLNIENKRGTPICVWGTHGLGKTQMIRDFAREKKMEICLYCSSSI
jgi:MoxR-like ATPase